MHHAVPCRSPRKKNFGERSTSSKIERRSHGWHTPNDLSAAKGCCGVRVHEDFIGICFIYGIFVRCNPTEKELQHQLVIIPRLVRIYAYLVFSFFLLFVAFEFQACVSCHWLSSFVAYVGIRRQVYCTRGVGNFQEQQNPFEKGETIWELDGEQGVWVRFWRACHFRQILNIKDWRKQKENHDALGKLIQSERNLL